MSTYNNEIVVRYLFRSSKDLYYVLFHQINSYSKEIAILSF